MFYQFPTLYAAANTTRTHNKHNKFINIIINVFRSYFIHCRKQNRHQLYFILPISPINFFGYLSDGSSPPRDAHAVTMPSYDIIGLTHLSNFTVLHTAFNISYYIYAASNVQCWGNYCFLIMKLGTLVVV